MIDFSNNKVIFNLIIVSDTPGTLYWVSQLLSNDDREGIKGVLD